MNKNILLLVITAMFLALSGCVTGNPANTENASNQSSAVSAKDQDVRVGDKYTTIREKHGDQLLFERDNCAAWRDSTGYHFA